MTKGILALGAFVGAVAISIYVFATVGHASLISTIPSPDNTYVVKLSGKKSRPRLPITEHAVYVDLFRHGKPVIRGRKLHSGDWFDPAFENLYADYSWVNGSTLMFSRRKSHVGSRDTVNLINNTSKSIKFLHVESSDLFLVFDLKPQARVVLSASPQTWLSWLTTEGEFEDGERIARKGINFEINQGQKGPFTYDIAINDDGPTISSSQLPAYRP